MIIIFFIFYSFLILSRNIKRFHFYSYFFFRLLFDRIICFPFIWNIIIIIHIMYINYAIMFKWWSM